MGRDTDSMRGIFDLSIKEIEKVLKGEKTVSDNTRLAASTLLSYSKIKMADINEEALRLGIKGGKKPKALGNGM